MPSYLDHYLIDNASGVILGVEATRSPWTTDLSGPSAVAAGARAVRDPSGKSGSRYALWQRRVLGLAAGAPDPTSYSGHRPPPPNPSARYSGRVSLRPEQECLSLPAGPSAALSREEPHGSRPHLPDYGVAVPGLSCEEWVHARPGPQALRPPARSSAAESSRLGPNPGVRSLPARTEQGRSPFLRTQAASGIAKGAPAPALECRRAVLLGSHRPEPQTTREVPRATTAPVGWMFHLRRWEGLGPGRQCAGR